MHFKRVQITIITLMITFSSLWGGVKISNAAVSVNQVIDEYPDVKSITVTADIQQSIQTNINKLLAENKHRDYFGAMLTEDVNRLMWDKGQAVWELSEIMPYLDTTTKANLKAYLQYEVTNYLLNSTYIRFENGGDMATKIPSAHFTWQVFYDGHATGAPAYEAFYGLWAYAQYTNDWTTIQNNWSTISSMYNDTSIYSDVKKILGSESMAMAMNSELAGRIGWARMNKKLYALTGSSSYQSAYQSAVNTISSRIAAMSNEQNYAPLTGNVCGWNPSPCPIRSILLDLPQFDFLTPELGRWEKDKYLAQATTVIANAEQHYPFWYLGSYNIIIGSATGGDGGAGEEGYFEPPVFAYQLFQAKAQILDTPTTELRQKMPWLNDFASMPGFWDILHYANLSSLIRRTEGVTWTDTNTPPSQITISPLPSNATPTPNPNLDINKDGKVDITDLKLTLTSYSGSITCQTYSCDVNGDSKVNTLDSVMVLENIGK